MRKAKSSAAPLHSFCGLVHISEHIFPYLGVRFVAITDHFDTANRGFHDGYIVPLTNMLKNKRCLGGGTTNGDSMNISSG